MYLQRVFQAVRLIG